MNKFWKNLWCEYEPLCLDHESHYGHYYTWKHHDRIDGQDSMQLNLWERTISNIALNKSGESYPIVFMKLETGNIENGKLSTS